MPSPAHERVYHVVRFQESAEADAFVRSLRGFLDSPRGEAWATKFHITEVWAPRPLADGPLEVYLSDSALMAMEAAAPPGSAPAVVASRGDELPSSCVLVMKGAEMV